MQSRRWQDYNYILLVAVLVLLGFGLAMVYSTTIGQSGIPALGPGSPFRRHLIFVAVGLLAMATLTLVDYHWLSWLAGPLYVLMLGLLGAVLAFGEERNGCKCWLGGGSLQPSEAAKVLLIIALASYWSLKEERQGSWLGLLGSLVVLGIPLALVLQQPDLGTSMVIVGAWGVMAWAAGLRWSQIGLLSAGGVAGAVMMWPRLEPHQKLRLITFINPEADPVNAGYQVLQSQNAIGAGGLLGQGLNHGLASQRNFLPVQSSDFVFAVVGEELGFVGATALLCLLMLVVFQAWRIAEQARDPFGRLLASGIGGVLLVHILENVGMTMGAMPMTGIPLPFISVGGTFIIVVLACMGILQSIALRHRPLVF